MATMAARLSRARQSSGASGRAEASSAPTSKITRISIARAKMLSALSGERTSANGPWNTRQTISKPDTPAAMLAAILTAVRMRRLAFSRRQDHRAFHRNRLRVDIDRAVEHIKRPGFRFVVDARHIL